MMGLSYNDLYDLTPRSFSNASKGFFELRKEDIRTSWEQVRVIASPEEIRKVIESYENKKIKKIN